MTFLVAIFYDLFISSYRSSSSSSSSNDDDGDDEDDDDDDDHNISLTRSGKVLDISR